MPTRSRVRSAAGRILLFGLLLQPAGTLATELAVTVNGVANGDGHVLVAVCTPRTFLGAKCPYTAQTVAAEGKIRVVVSDIEPGVYAVQSFHDENDNLAIDRNLFGLPSEGMGFSRDAPMDFGPPRFDDAAVEISGTRTAVELRMRYFD